MVALCSSILGRAFPLSMEAQRTSRGILDGQPALNARALKQRLDLSCLPCASPQHEKTPGTIHNLHARSRNRAALWDRLLHRPIPGSREKGSQFQIGPRPKNTKKQEHALIILEGNQSQGALEPPPRAPTLLGAKFGLKGRATLAEAVRCASFLRCPTGSAEIAWLPLREKARPTT